MATDSTQTKPGREIRQRGVAEFLFHPRHGDAEILGRAGPAGGVNSRIAAQGIHPQAGIIGQRRMLAGIGGAAGFQFGIGDKGGSGLFGFGQSQIRRTERLDAMRGPAAP